MPAQIETNYIKWFRDITLSDVPLVGGKTASLGEMYRNLNLKGIEVPNGFGIVADAYWFFLAENGLRDKVQDLLQQIVFEDAQSLQAGGQKVRGLFMEGSLPKTIENQILKAFRELLGSGDFQSVAVRSSATAEDLPGASFAGQQETFLNVRSERELLEACKQCLASLFTDRAISYRKDMHFDHFDVALSIAVQGMVRSDIGSSGVMFTIDTETGFKDSVLINASYGLGEYIVKGAVNPDEFYVFKPTLKSSPSPIIRKKIGSKEVKLTFDGDSDSPTREESVTENERNRFCIDDSDILNLARWACEIEEYYSKLHGQLTPMDIEWAKDGLSGKIWILQARPETIHTSTTQDSYHFFVLKEKGPLVTEGRAVGEKIGSGPVRMIQFADQLKDFKLGDVLVTDKTDPDWEPMMKLASAIITNRGGRTCHAAIVSRELGIPAVVGARNATSSMQNGEDVTVSCAEGDTGRVYRGRLAFEEQTIRLKDYKAESNTKIMMNIANPDEAFRLSSIPNDGVGLARMEFIITHDIRIHPMALIHFDAVQDPATRGTIEQITKVYPSKTEYYIDRLSQGIGTLAAAFYPKDVIVRFSDFKSNEYAKLLGGETFERKEENPMLGLRGASRYYHDSFKEAFALECQAVMRVRKGMGLKNLKVMIPFCRTVEEGRKVLQVMETNGLTRKVDGLEIYMMCEIPSNVILAEQFAELFDGFSIGSNDLTQLILGVDRDSEVLSDVFDERNEAVMAMISEIIRKAKKSGTKIGICGQAPSDYPSFATFLVQEGIDSLSLNPDSVMKTRALIESVPTRPD